MRQSCSLEPDGDIVIVHDRAYRREDDARMQRFVDDDRSYFDWLDHHPDGFVINTGRRTASAAYLMLHRANCGTISCKPRQWNHFHGRVRHGVR